MGQLFQELCKGPVVVVDNRIGDGSDLINKLIEEIKENALPVLEYTTIRDARDKLQGMLFSNFIILDWKMTGAIEEIPTGVQTGAELEAITEQEVIEFIKELRKICVAPIFILSAFDKDWIVSELEREGILSETKDWVFVENKSTLCETRGVLISKIEEWIENSPHIYLAKCWTNEWLAKNTAVFWDLYQLNPNWPTLFYRSFEAEEDPILALRDTLFQLVFSEINVSEIDPSFINKAHGDEDKELEKESLKNLYRRLVYIERDIDKDIKPGDIFKRDGSYYINIRPECDTTRRTSNPKIYLLKGDVKTSEDTRESYKPPYGIIDKENQITMLLLDGKDFVVFDKRKFSVVDYSTWKKYKIYRVTHPFITQIRQSYSSYLGRFGVPSYPTQMLESLFESSDEPNDG